MSSPVLIIVYNRLQHLQKCVQSLSTCDLSDETVVYISSDAAYKIQDECQINEIRKYIQSIGSFKKVVPIFHQTNKGLVKAIRDSVDIIFKEHDEFIFLEDDNIVAVDFLRYMNAGLQFYKSNPRVISVSGFSHAVFFDVDPSQINQTYFTSRHCPWGFATWKEKYLDDNQYSLSEIKLDLEDNRFIAELNKIGIDLLPSFKNILQQGKMLSADYLFVYHMIKNNLVTVAPYTTKSFNTGNDGSGTRTKRSDKFVNFDINRLSNKVPFLFNEDIDSNLNNTFNERINNTNTSRLKMRLDKLGLLRAGYVLNGLKKKWI